MSLNILRIRGISDAQKAQLQHRAHQLHGRASASLRVKALINADLCTPHPPLPLTLQPPNTPGDDSKTRKSRLELRLLPGERNALETLAEHKKSGLNYYVTSLIRAHLVHTPQLQGDELEQLRQSNYQLLAIGRNLNQIARHLNETGQGEITSAAIAELRAAIKEHTRSVSQLIEANLQRWDVGHE